MLRDAICLLYEWRQPDLPSSSVCGKSYSIDHCLTCPYGGFPTLRHNGLGDLSATLLKEVWSNVCRKPSLQPLTGEVLRYRTVLTDDYVCPKETQNRTKNQCTMSRDYRIYGKSSNN